MAISDDGDGTAIAPRVDDDDDDEDGGGGFSFNGAVEEKKEVNT
ncbi:hypothetical protein A2U01_0063865 [Trifolium medium]|uniref:Uncharacterized protein n=1 Tax=Trifolium medium TaxID=97028 RepID=A0A392S1A3_9FABA|nr:hypothetical protein [Trifolium medium]